MVYLYKYKLEPEEKKSSLRFIKDSLIRCFPGEGGAFNVYKDQEGRPLTDKEGVYVSATHTGDIVICAVSGCPVGIDAQTVKDGLETERIAKRFFTDAENKIIQRGKDEDFYRIWCRKEAFSKVVGKGISYGLRNIETVNDKGEFASDIKGYRVIDETISEGYFSCVGGEGELIWIEIQE